MTPPVTGAGEACLMPMDGLPDDASSEILPQAPMRAWLAVLSVALGSFALVTSEFMPVGVLTKVAADLHATEGATGLMVTTPGIVAAFAAPGVMMGAGRTDRRLILWALSALLVVSNLVVAAAPNLGVLLAGRFLLGIDVGAFWAIGSVIALKMVPAHTAARATAVIFAGISLGTVLGVPVGTLLGDAFGWRASFAGIAGFGVLVLLAQLVFLKPLPASEAVTLKHLKAIFAIPKARLGLFANALVITGQFGAYTYMGAFLEQVTRATPALISAMLLGYGVAGFAGNFLGSAAVQRDVRRTFAGTALLLGAAIVLLPAIGQLQAPAAILVVLWGLAFGALPISMQSWLLKAAPEEMESASAMFISVLQVGLAAGALLGGVAVDHWGLSPTMAGSGCAALLTAALIWVLGRDRVAAR
jgi:predicted MFS family arabinose efflux permease